ncbi:unnamed protein product [Rotaria sordida]|uniref:Uncharacterized protein n=1 Tax=Rotaria sordida TaxID=392033 RepID=A0A815KF00_9BILA|nr:unnamed protein product [Rotaria sordida]CAF1620715.1 unnamed protein product [Rotaria sordida]
MSQLTQDFHRPTVELGLESSFTHDVTSSSNEPAEQLSSTGLNENFNVSETTNDLQTTTLTDNNNKNSTKIELQQNLSTPDLKKMQPEQKTTSPSSVDLKINDVEHNFSDSIINDDRISAVQHVVNNLHQCLDKLKDVYASVAQSSDTQDVMLKKHIEQIYNDLRLRITNEQQQNDECGTDTITVFVTDESL